MSSVGISPCRSEEYDIIFAVLNGFDIGHYLILGYTMKAPGVSRTLKSIELFWVPRKLASAQAAKT